MKKLALPRLTLLALLLGIGLQQANAQLYIGLHGGATVPVGFYAESRMSDNEWMFTQGHQRQAGSGTGWAAGVDFSYAMPFHSNLEILLAADFMQSGVSRDVEEYFTLRFSQRYNQCSRYEMILPRLRNIPILAIHGDADKVMPYDYGYPFAVADPLNTLIVDKMYGATSIIEQANRLGYQSRLVTFSGCKHALHLDPKTKDLNDNFFVIQDVMSDFFYSIIMPEELEIAEEGSSYSLRPQPIATSWQVEGGIILNESDSHVEVQWIKNAPKRSITASATLPYGLGFKTTKTIN